MLYIITTWNGTFMYQYIFEFEIIEYFREPDEREKIAEAFYSKSGVSREEKIIDVNEAPYVRYIK